MAFEHFQKHPRTFPCEFAVYTVVIFEFDKPLTGTGLKPGEGKVPLLNPDARYDFHQNNGTM